MCLRDTCKTWLSRKQIHFNNTDYIQQLALTAWNRLCTWREPLIKSQFNICFYCSRADVIIISKCDYELIVHQVIVSAYCWVTDPLNSEAGKSLSTASDTAAIRLRASCQHAQLMGQKDEKTATERAKCKMNRDTGPDFRPEQQHSSHVASTSGTHHTHVISKGESWILTCLNTCGSRPRY